MVKGKRLALGAIAAGVVAVGAGYLVALMQGDGNVLSTNAAAEGTAAAPRAQWAASATGRVEPKEGSFRLAAESAGKIEDVLVKNNDRVAAGDLLVRLDDREALDRMKSADAEVQVRKRERDSDAATGLALDRRKAEDELADAERALFGAQLALDEAQVNAHRGNGKPEDVTGARERVTSAERRVATERDELLKVLGKANMPLPTRLEAALVQARADLALAEEAVRHTRLHTPFAGTVLDVAAKAGELATPSGEAALVTMGDLSALRVRAEVEDRDVTKVRVGQGVVVRTEAFPDRDFEGKVSAIAPSLGSQKITSRGPRKPDDVDVLEVFATLDGTPPLLTGMRVDVFFKIEENAAAK